jgi:hypothetical protein
MRFMFFMVVFFAIPTTRFRRLVFTTLLYSVFWILSSFLEASESGSSVHVNCAKIEASKPGRCTRANGANDTMFGFEDGPTFARSPVGSHCTAQTDQLRYAPCACRNFFAAHTEGKRS